MEFTIEGRCVVTLEHKEGQNTSSHVATDFNLDVSKNLNRKQYLDKEDLPTKDGTKALTQCFVQGLVGNIHQAHQKGYWDSAEHLRYIIAELERGFATVANAYTSNFKS
jgi:hypothetical protein